MTGQTRWTKTVFNPQGIIPNCYPTRQTCMCSGNANIILRKKEGYESAPKCARSVASARMRVCPGPAVDTAGRGAAGHRALDSGSVSSLWSILDELGSPNIAQLGQVPQPAMQIR